MKASELMIDDWVLVGNHYYQIEEIRKEYGEYRMSLKGTAVFATESEIEPIKLKKIHLLKNGFYAKDVDDTIFVFRDGYQITVQFDEGINDPENDLQIPPLAYLSIKFAEKDLWLPIEYVHELQHEMKSFETDKQIIL